MPEAKMFVLSLCNHHFLLPVKKKPFSFIICQLFCKKGFLFPSNYLQLLQKLVLENCQILKYFFARVADLRRMLLDILYFSIQKLSAHTLPRHSNLLSDPMDFLYFISVPTTSRLELGSHLGSTTDHF